MKAPCSGSQARALLPIYRGPARRAPPTSLKEPARLRHQPGACALIHLIFISVLEGLTRPTRGGETPLFKLISGFFLFLLSLLSLFL